VAAYIGTLLVSVFRTVRQCVYMYIYIYIYIYQSFIYSPNDDAPVSCLKKQY